MTGQVRTVDGRVAGRRGQATRQKLLDCLSEMLSSSPYPVSYTHLTLPTILLV